MPVLRNLEQNKDILHFIDSNFIVKNKNFYTFLVGKNSVGKSRLLRSIIIHSLEIGNFDQVIALSNTQYHKFPSYRQLPTKTNDSSQTYILLGFEPRHTFLLSGYNRINRVFLLKNQYNFVFEFFEKNEIRYYRNSNSNLNFINSFELFLSNFSFESKSNFNLQTILNFLKLDHYVRCSISNISDTHNNKDISTLIKNYFAENKSLTNSEQNILLNIIDSLQNIPYLRTFNLFQVSNDELKTISFLLELGLIRISRVSFSKNKEIFNYSDLSSGELSVMSLILGLTATISDNSLICIDEPEINLHPQWQEKIIELIELVSENYSGCHFFIATHSPQLISGIKEPNSFILDLSSNNLKNINDFKNRSSDFQLSEIFNFPGNNNEYLIRKLLVLLNELNSEENFVLDFESLELLEHIEFLIYQDKIDKDDKVQILFNLINSYRG